MSLVFEVFQTKTAHFCFCPVRIKCLTPFVCSGCCSSFPWLTSHCLQVWNVWMAQKVLSMYQAPARRFLETGWGSKAGNGVCAALLKPCRSHLYTCNGFASISVVHIAKAHHLDPCLDFSYLRVECSSLFVQCSNLFLRFRGPQ